MDGGTDKESELYSPPKFNYQLIEGDGEGGSKEGNGP